MRSSSASATTSLSSIATQVHSLRRRYRAKNNANQRVGGSKAFGKGLVRGSASACSMQLHAAAYPGRIAIQSDSRYPTRWSLSRPLSLRRQLACTLGPPRPTDSAPCGAGSRHSSMYGPETYVSVSMLVTVVSA